MSSVFTKNKNPLWKRISYLGLNYYANYSEIRTSIIANRINFVFWIVILTNSLLLAIIRHFDDKPITVYSYKLLVLFGFCTMALLFAFLKWHKLMKLILVFAPGITFVFFPVVLNKFMEVEIIFDPLLLIGYSIIPQLIFRTSFKNTIFILSLLFYFLLIVFYYDIIFYKLEGQTSLFKSEENFGLYYKMGFSSIFIFIHTSLLYLQLQNLQREEDLKITRKRAETQSKLISKKNVQLLRGEKKLQDALNTKDKFFSIIAHDLKNPLNAMIGLASIVNTRYDNIEEKKKRKYIFHIHKAAVELYKLIENLLQWGRLQTESLVIHPENFYVSDIIKSCIKLTEATANKKNIQLKSHINKHMHVYADAAMISIVIRNLISNAIKFTPENGTISISADSNIDDIKISVTDTGVGINEKHIPKLFRLDISFSTTGTAGETGTGLGLILCKEFIEKNNGQIGVSSEENKGSTFWFSLPVKEPVVNNLEE